MDTGGGTGSTEQESDEEGLNLLREGVEIALITYQPAVQIIGNPPIQYPINIHALRVFTSTSSVTVHIRGFPNPSLDSQLSIAEELIRTARARLREGTLQPAPTNQQQPNLQ